ncbi:WD repeat-containing protein 72-like [Polypterus senegalus]|uniref:WD repeat-containing protein 72-like n=1 Tax=Polypterus senegalus TaxID=55291 RepID=UPI001962EF16|nr:WD repeat-containing protein 72-like [Polypterus senegalus]XP_039626217.1 WD repeat-containing protein 72-like [Polypterus senegalus]XP_039626218.1 WD repeat-containing protein 72-like [Polypterus senegalus]
MKASTQSLTLWGKRAPRHTITAIMLTEDQQTIVTGSQEGPICLWTLSMDLQISPRALLIGHTEAVTCVAKARDFEKKPYVVSATINGEMSLWDVRSGECVEATKRPYTHRTICYYYSSSRMVEEGWLLCCGEYPDVLVVDAQTLDILYKLISTDASNWISSMCIVRSPRIHEDSLIGISTSGVLKVWELSSSIYSVYEKGTAHETESRDLQCLQCQSIRFCTYTERLLLIVCSDFWKVFDYCDFSLVCDVPSEPGRRFAGGEPLPANRLIVWTEDGHSYIYQLSDRGLHRGVSSSLQRTSANEMFSPDMLCFTSNNKVHQGVMGFLSERKEPFYKILFFGDESGTITLWHIPDVPVSKPDGSPEETSIASSCSLDVSFKKFQVASICGHVSIPAEGKKTPAITASLYLPNHHLLVCGFEDGKIMRTHVLQAARVTLLEDQQKDRLPQKTFQGHAGSVTCLLYPHSYSDSFESSWLISGGQDSCVIQWDVLTSTVLHRFTLQAGPLLTLSVPPAECSPKVHKSICCLASDQSIALLNLPEQTCIMHARKHLFPVKTIKWRPVEDFLVVECEDGSVYVWEAETGALDRHETGDLAKAILWACDDSRAGTKPGTPAGVKPQNGAKRVGSSPPASPTETAEMHSHLAIHEPVFHPFSVQSLDTPCKDIHILQFDVEEILELIGAQPEQEQDLISSLNAPASIKRVKSTQRKRSILKKNKTSSTLLPVNGPLKDFVRDHLFQNENNSCLEEGTAIRKKSKSKRSKKSRKQSKKRCDENVTRDLAQLLLSCLFPWEVLQECDEFCLDTLGISKPQFLPSFALVSKAGYMSLILPGSYTEMESNVEGNGYHYLISHKVADLAKHYANSNTEEISFIESTGDLKMASLQKKIITYLLSIVMLVSSLMKLHFPERRNKQARQTREVWFRTIQKEEQGSFLSIKC